MILTSFLKAIAQMGDRRFLWVWLKGLFLSVLLFAVTVGLVAFALAKIDFVKWGWLDGTITGLGSVAAIVLAVIFFPGLALLVISQFLEPICRAVEAKHYPSLGEARSGGIREAVGGATRLGFLTVVLNLLCLPAYLIPGVNLAIFFGLNGILLGREYFELVALRRLEPATMKAVKRRHRPRIFLNGVVITALLAIPFVGWTMAVISTAMMVHEFEKIRAKSGTLAQIAETPGEEVGR